MVENTQSQDTDAHIHTQTLVGLLSPIKFLRIVCGKSMVTQD